MSYFYIKMLYQETPSYPVSVYWHFPLNARNKKASEKLFGKTFKLNRLNLCSDSCFVHNLLLYMHVPDEQNIRKIKIDVELNG